MPADDGQREHEERRRRGIGEGGQTIDAYLAELARCTTENQFNRLHLAFETYYAPAELCALVDGTRARGVPLPEPARLWLDRTDTTLRGRGQPVQPYERRIVADGVLAYRAPGTPEERARRTLVVAFSGNAFRLMLPAGMFLQHCPADRYEFLFLHDRQRSLFLKGIAGLTTDLAGTMAWVAAAVERSPCRRVVGFGTSAGGLPAVWTAIELGFVRGVSVGGMDPGSVGTNVYTQGSSAEGFHDAVRRRAAHLPEIVLVAGDACELDIEKAEAMSRVVPATHVRVPRFAKHNVLFELWTRGELEPFLARLLGEPMPAA